MGPGRAGCRTLHHGFPDRRLERGAGRATGGEATTEEVTLPVVGLAWGSGVAATPIGVRLACGKGMRDPPGTAAPVDLGSGVATKVGDFLPERCVMAGAGTAKTAAPSVGGPLLLVPTALPTMGSAMWVTHGARAKLAPSSRR
jgi:hypothetical protein